MHYRQRWTTRTWWIGLASLMLAASLTAAAPAGDLEQAFRQPPAEARPWVYWFWLNGNITREGITADLEAMQRVGIGGVLIMEVDQGTPKGPAAFGRSLWRELFKHVCAEAHRLGLEVNMNNDAGWCGSGGPWITPELAMQKLVWTETAVEGPKRFEGLLAEPKAVAGYYRDIAVLAFPTPAGKVRIENIEGKSALVPQYIPARSQWPAVPADATIRRDRIVDLTANLAAGRLSWDVPEGKWTVLRLGHTPTGVENHPAPQAGLGLECDKLSPKAIEAQYKGLIGKLVADVGPLAGKTLVSTHIDSWETGSQNWTPRMREEFQKRRGYDLWKLLPAVTGRVVDSSEVSERFLWDLRQTVSDLLVENYAGHLADLAHKDGLRLSIEGYDGTPCDDMTYAGRADEPMCEFWSWGNDTSYSCVEMSSVAHTYGKRILGAEAFTATDGEKWLHHPASIKTLGDWAFCAGVNRFVFHRYALQPWKQRHYLLQPSKDRRPGMSMGPWGLHYERSQTWWEQSKAWHEYLARCQYLLRKGLFVADVCYLNPEGSPQRFQSPVGGGGNTPDRPRYNFDGCSAEVLLTRMEVKYRRLVLPDGMSYRLLVLPKIDTMTPGLLRRVKDLVEAGATVLGDPPVKSPSLSGFPACDAEVKQLAAELWGDCDGKKVTAHRLGKGWVVQGKTPEEVLMAKGVLPDFDYRSRTSPDCLRYIHRGDDAIDLYFVANKTDSPQEAVAAFHMAAGQPELFWPESGRIEQPAVYDVGRGQVRVPLRLEPTGSVFVIFRHPAAQDAGDRIVSVTRNGQPLMSTNVFPAKSAAYDNANITGTFTMSAWVEPQGEIALPVQSNAGNKAYQTAQNYAIYPAPGHEVYSTKGQAGAGVSVGRNGVVVFEHSADYFAPILVHAVTLSGWTHLAVVYHDGQPSLYLDGKPVATGLKSTWTVHPSAGVHHGRQVAAFRGQVAALGQSRQALSEDVIAKLMAGTAAQRQAKPAPAFSLACSGDGYRLESNQAGTYELKTAGGKSYRAKIGQLPPPLEIAGPWELHFTPGWGAPAKVTLEKLISWSQHSDPGVKYFSGTATYHKQLDVPASLPAKDRRLYLDLGDVQVMAEVKINGKDLGILWKPPYRADVTDAVHAGANALEIKVVNLWVNRMIGDEQLAEDSDRNPNGTLRKWPDWLDQDKLSPTGRYTFTSWRLWHKDSPLLPSGLLGPVQLEATQQVEVK